MIRRIDNRDFWAGVVFVAIGIAALVLGRDLNVGTAADMGEGYVPLVMAIAQIALGMLIVLITLWRDLADSGNRFDGVRWRPMFFVTAAILAFVMTLEPLGLVAAIASSAIAANFAGQPLRARPLVILICVLSLGVIAVFIWGLGLPLHALPTIGE